MRRLILLLLLMFAAPALAQPSPGYYDRAGRDDAWSGGVRMIPIHTPRGDFRVWTRRVGNNPRLKVLLLHGGPAMTHEYFEAFDSFFPGEGIEYYYYDQLGSAYSDQPNDDALWTIPRFVDEVEQVRRALGLDRGNFCLLGHSWGGMLAIEYALAHQDALKCLIISNMMDSIPAYNVYAHDVLMPAMDQTQLRLVQELEASHRTEDPRYMQTLLPMHYEQHILRRPFAQWPEPVLRSMGRLNQHLYTLMQGPSELGASGRLVDWDRSADLHMINVPTLVIGARYDTMNPAWMQAMANRLPRGRYLYCPQGSHMAMYDDQACYFGGLIRFLRGVERSRP
ncbi:MAG TPA: proline iminopeptidase-family hydrolase [Allosphingosinicella sp.]|nr:proline iminopeptidase-family hydrolase [Allosphingosinicella sp.]